MMESSELNSAEVEFRQACERLGVPLADVGSWDRDDRSFVGADGRTIKEKDDVLLTRSVPVSSGARWIGGNAPPASMATVLMFSTGVRGMVHLECYCEPDGFAFGWEETSHLRLHRTTEQKWPK